MRKKPAITYRSMQNCKDLREKLLGLGWRERRKKLPLEDHNYEGVFLGKAP
jgi:hypothetical protein